MPNAVPQINYTRILGIGTQALVFLINSPDDSSVQPRLRTTHVERIPLKRKNWWLGSQLGDHWAPGEYHRVSGPQTLVNQNHLEGLLKCRFAEPQLSASESASLVWGLRMCISHHFPGDTDPLGIGTSL